MSIELGIVNKCIYCQTTEEPLQDEHVVPYGLNGPWVLRKASCRRCAVITSTFERAVLKGSLLEFRSARALKTRRKKQKPQTFLLSLNRGGKEESVAMTAEELPAVLMLPIYEQPAHLTGKPFKRGINVIGATTIQTGGLALQDLIKKYGATGLTFKQVWQGNEFERLLAKIAYGFSVSYVGLDKIAEVFVLPAILGIKDDIGLWLGCTDDQLKRGKYFHEIQISMEGPEIRAHIRLFGTFPVPEYQVVVGRIKEQINSSA